MPSAYIREVDLDPSGQEVVVTPWPAFPISITVDPTAGATARVEFSLTDVFWPGGQSQAGAIWHLWEPGDVTVRTSATLPGSAHAVRVTETAASGRVKGQLTAAKAKPLKAQKAKRRGPVGSNYDQTILAASPLLYYKLDETSGVIAVDSSGNGDDGGYQGTVILGASPVASDGGTSVTLDGTAAEHINLANSIMQVPLRDSPCTVELWFRTTDTTGPLVVSRTSSNPIFGMYLGANGLTVDDGKILCLVRDNGGGGLTELKSILRYDDGNPHHVAWVFNGNVAQDWELFVDGASVNTGVHNLGQGITPVDAEIGRDPLTAGAAPHGSLAGDVDNFAFYDSALSAATILAHYNAGM